jgi:hypothetical protein
MAVYIKLMHRFGERPIDFTPTNILDKKRNIHMKEKETAEERGLRNHPPLTTQRNKLRQKKV